MEIRKAWSFRDDVKSRNSQLQKLLGFCTVNKMVVQNTIYQITDIHKYTCKGKGRRFIIN